jgi:hypothetical protein
MNKLWFFIAPALIALAACSSSPALTSDQIAAAMPTAAAARTQTAGALPASATITATVAPSSTPTLTPLPASALTATADFALYGPHGDGVYQVGVSIAPGTWRAIPQRNSFCYWARRKYDGILLGEHYGPAGGEIFIHETDFEVEFDDCGLFVFMGN